MHAPAGNAAGEAGAMLPSLAQAHPRIGPLPAALSFPQSRRILVVEDDAPLARLLASGLSAESFAVDLVHDAEAAARALAVATPELVMLDLNLPGMEDGLALLKMVRSRHPRVPVLVLTGRSRTEDTVRALDSGADDCLLKPFSLLELMARVRVLLRRASGMAEAARQPGLTLDPAEYRAIRSGRTINLTPREFAVLDFLMQHAGQPVSRATLMREVWKMPQETNTNIVDVYMKYLRDKIDGPGEEKLVCTVRGIGYVLRNG